MGINFKQANDKLRKQYRLEAGAASVVTVYPASPAKAAGLEAGDVILGPPRAPFQGAAPDQGVDDALGGRAVAPARRANAVTGRCGSRSQPAPYPIRLPELPGPPKVGSAAPALKVGAYRGTLPARLADGRQHLLFFWATWCLPMQGCNSRGPRVRAGARGPGDRDHRRAERAARRVLRAFQGAVPPTPSPSTTSGARSRRTA
jgi:hypothetical protein